MAYLQPSKWLEQQKQGAQDGTAPALSAQPQLSSAPAASVAPVQSGAPAGGSGQQSNSPDSSFYPNISAYLSAGQQAGEKMRSQLASQEDSQVSGVQKARDQYSADWTSQNQKALDDWQKQNDQAYQGYLEAAQPSTRQDRDQATNDQERYDTKHLRSDLGPFQPSAAPQATAWSPDTSAATNAYAQLQGYVTDPGTAASALQPSGFGPDYTPGMAAMDGAMLAPAVADLQQRYGSILNALRNSGSAPALSVPTLDYPPAGKKRGS